MIDDVCEQATPNTFYDYCKRFYSTESDVIDAIRYGTADTYCQRFATP